jgi:hypothetical protein
MDLTETGRSDMNWIILTQDRNQMNALVNTAMNLPVE